MNFFDGWRFVLTIIEFDMMFFDRWGFVLTIIKVDMSFLIDEDVF
jgi:hypothetical protein